MFIMNMRLQGETSALTADSQRPRVVVADDNPACLDEICNLLEARFEIVARVANGLECVDAVQEFLPAAVVTDISMPKMNGIQATAKIAKTWPGVKVIILSCHDDPAFMEAALDAGASSYVIKSCAFD